LEGSPGEPNIYLGHNRLAIIDLSDDGVQPFSNDGVIHIVFNGEIYNYLELRADLQKKGYNFRTKTDTEVIVNLYKDQGVEGFAALNGMWAFMIFDSRKKKVILSRDRFSIKPLYYVQNGGLVVYGSEIKQLLPFLPRVEVNKSVMYNYLKSYTVNYSEKTFFHGVTRVPPKHTVIVDLQNGKVTSQQYWDFSPQGSPQRSESSLIEEYRHLLQDSVAIRLRSDVEVGNTLSGGLDSSSIAVLADKMAEKPIVNLSVVTKNKHFSEEQFLDELASKNNVRLRKIMFDESNPWSSVSKVIWHNDEPILSLSTVAHFKMMESFKRETDIKVILSGQGGDESLAGYNKYFFYNLLDAKRKKDFRRMIAEGVHLAPKFYSEFGLKEAKRYLPWSNRISTVVDKVLTYIPDDTLNLTFFTGLRERQILDINKLSVPALTHYEDRSSMHQSLEIRLPFLDYRLIDFSVNLPANMKIHNGYSKYILRKSITELPPRIAWRKDKKGFGLDENSYFTEEVVENIISMFDSSRLAELGMIDAEKFQIEFRAFIAGKRKYWSRNINRIIFAEMWMREFIR
jgi:asparagine synthase (glutamine-hydrolysing)